MCCLCWLRGCTQMVLSAAGALQCSGEMDPTASHMATLLCPPTPRVGLLLTLSCILPPSCYRQA